MAKSGHPGMPMGMADAATVLFTRFLKHDAADPRWPDRDRFVLSAGHGSMLLYAWLHLTGHAGMGMEELQSLPSVAFRRRRPPGTTGASGDRDHHRPARPGDRDRGRHGAWRSGTSPPGSASLVDHRTWVIASDGDLQEGISHEAASPRRAPAAGAS